MSEAVQIALVAAIAPVIALLASHWVSNTKLDHIQKMTNGPLKEANEKIDKLEKLIIRLIEKSESKRGEK